MEEKYIYELSNENGWQRHFGSFDSLVKFIKLLPQARAMDFDLNDESTIQDPTYFGEVSRWHKVIYNCPISVDESIPMELSVSKCKLN